MEKNYLTLSLRIFSNAFLVRLLLAVAGLLITLTSLSQTTHYWQNAQNPPANANWSTASLWSPSLPAGSEVLVFDASSANMTSVNNLAATNRFQIVFESSPPAGSRILNGNTPNTFYDYSGSAPAIINLSTVNQTVNFPILHGNNIGAKRLEIESTPGDITIGVGGTIGANGAPGDTRNLVAWGTGDINFNGVISNGNCTLNFVKESINSVYFNAGNSYTGTTSVTLGTLLLGIGGTFGINSRVFISNGGVLDLNGVNASVQSVEETGSGNGGIVMLGSGTLTVLGGYAGTRYQSSIAGTGGLIKQGGGIMSLYNGQPYTGATVVSGGELSASGNMGSTVYTINGGIFRIAAANIIPDAANITMSSGTFAVDNDETINNLNISAGGTLVVAAGRTLTIRGTFTGGLGNITNNGTIVFASGSTVTNFPGAGTVTINNLTANSNVVLNNPITVTGTLSVGASSTFSLNGNNVTTALLTAVSATAAVNNGNAVTAATLTVNNTAAGSFAGSLSNGAAAALSITKLGTGNLTISGTNTYSGATTIAAGTLTAAGSVNSLPVNNNINISNNAVLALGAGFTGSRTLGLLQMTSGASLDVAAAGAIDLRFANSNAMGWTGTFTVLNWTPAAAKNIFFTGQGLTATQLSNFNFDGYGIGAKFEGGAFPDKVVPKYLYITNGTGGGNFSLAASWQNGDMPVLNSGVESIFIRSTDVLTQDVNGYLLFSASVAGNYSIGANTLNIAGGAVPGNIATTATGTLSVVASSIINFGSGAALNNAGIISALAGSAINLGSGGIFNNSGIVNGAAGSAINFNAAGGTLAHTGVPNYSTSTTIYFPGPGTITGTATLPVINISGPVNFGTGSTIGTSLIINTTGSVVTNAPKYGILSTLYYYQLGVANRGLEWIAGTTSTAAAGYPNNVMVGNGVAVTSLNLNNSAIYQMGGNLTVAALSALTLNDNSTPYHLSVIKDVNITGTLTLGNIVTGPPQYIGDLWVGGNFTRNPGGTFNPNQRAVFFTGNTNQTIDGSGSAITFAYFSVNNTGSAGNNTVQLAAGTDAIIDGGIGGYSFQMLNGNFDLNGRTLTFRTYTYGLINQVYIDGTAGNLTRQVTSSVNPGFFNFTNTDASQRITTVVRKNAGSASLLSFSPNVIVNVLATGAGRSGVDFGNAHSIINGILQINPNTFVSNNPPYYGNLSSVPAASSTLIYQTGGAYTRSAEWNTALINTPGYANHVVVRDASTLNFTGTVTDIGCAGNLYVGHTNNTTGTVDLGIIGTDLYVGGDVVIGGNSGASTLKLSDTYGGDIYIAGGWNRNANGIINFGGANGRAVFFNGSANGSIAANGGETFPYVYLVKSNAAAAVTLADNITITDEIGFTQGTFDLASKNVTIKSSALKTARVSESNAANTIFPYSGAGRFVIERNAGALRSWRFLTAPIKSSQTIRAAWMEGAVPSTTTPLFNDDPVPGYGTHITGPLPAINGFDQNPTTYHSIKYYSGGLWSGVANTNVDITSEKGFMLFIRGDRSYSIATTTNTTTPATTTLRTTGKINIGDMPPVLTAGLTVVGNPYASAINFSSITKVPSSRANDIFYIWDPKITSGTTSTTVGGWITMTRDISGTNYIPSVMPVSNTIDLFTGRIESGAAIMVNSANLTSITIKESDKSAANALVFRPVGQSASLNKMLRTNLYVKNNDNTHSIFDGVVHLFDETYSNDVNGEDANKLSNFSENFSISKRSQLLSIEKRSPLKETDTIFYNLGQMKLRNYTIELEPANLAVNNLAGFIEDSYLQTSTPINMDASTKVNFTVTTNAGSYAPNRFRVVFRKSVQYTEINAAAVNSDITVDWKVANEININRYEVERSTNGIDFERIGSVNALSAGNGSVSYNWLDRSPGPGTYYYRIRCVSNNGVLANSSIVSISMLKQSLSMYVFPNPVSGNSINLYMNAMPGGVYRLQLTNATGQRMFNKSIIHNEGTVSEAIGMDKPLAKGNYQLEVLNAAGIKKQTLKITIQ